MFYGLQTRIYKKFRTNKIQFRRRITGLRMSPQKHITGTLGFMRLLRN